jgi:hypothetical protein
MTVSGVGRGERSTSLGPVFPTAHANRVTYDQAGLQQWYASGPLGIEQGFTVAHRPPGAAGPLTIAMALGGSLRAQLAGADVMFRAPSGRLALKYGDLSAVDASGRHLPATLTLSGHSLLLHVADRGARYPLRIDPMVQQGEKLTPAEGEEGSGEFGWAVAVSGDGNTVLVGAPSNKVPPPEGTHGPLEYGAAWEFTRVGSEWKQQKLEGGGEELEAHFGYSVALSADGKTALIGGPYDAATPAHAAATETGFGAVWVFTRSEAGTWTQQGPKLTGLKLAGVQEQIGKGDFGASVALASDGNTALIGGWTDNHFKGAAWVFTRAGSTWTPQAKLTGGGESGEGEFGEAVALSADGNTALMGGPGDTSFNGAAWVFTRAGTTWSQDGEKLTGRGGEGRSNFGLAVALSAEGNTALIGGPYNGPPGQETGAAWVFTRSGSEWNQQGEKLTGHCAESGGRFGESVALSREGNLALIGGPHERAQEGAVWAFTRSGETWTQDEELTAGGEQGPGEFGEYVALSENGNAAVIGGNADNGRRGAVWVFSGSPSVTTISCPTTSTTASSTSTTSTTSSTTSTGHPTPPALSDVTQSHSTWREGNTLAKMSARRHGRGDPRTRKPPVGTTFSFALNEQARVSFAFTQQISGRKVRGKCVAQTHKNRRRHACKRTMTVGTLSFNGHPGKNNVAFQGRITPGQKLKPGRYTLLITATNSAGQHSSAARLSFTIVK